MNLETKSRTLHLTEEQSFNSKLNAGLNTNICDIYRGQVYASYLGAKRFNMPFMSLKEYFVYQY